MEKMLLLPGILLIVLSKILPNIAQNLPYIECPQLFEYLSFNQQYIGHISIRHNPNYEVNELVVEFSQQGAYQWNYVGSLSLFDDQETTKRNLRNGLAINYRVDFPIPSIPPKLTHIRLNNEVLCSASLYPTPRTAIALMHSLRSSTVPLFIQPVQPVQPIYNFPPIEQQIYNYTPFEQQPINFRPFEQQTNNIGSFEEPELTTPRAVRPRPSPTQRTVRPRPSPTQRTVRPRPTAVVRLTPPVTQNVQPNDVCGRERAITTPLIFQGKPLERGQLPWLVGLFERDQSNGLTFFCGGTLISSSTVISAAHCFLFTGRDLPANQAVVSLGRNSIDIISNGELRDVSELLIHEQYKLSSYKQPDMALIRLATKVPFTDYIVPICLWNENLPQQLPSGYKAYVAGWGADGNGNSNTKFSKITDIDIITESNCLRELPAGLVQSQTICAKKNGAGPCASDGGGGLMLRENNVWLLRGVISASAIRDNTCDLSKPSVYSDVARQIDWVRQNMWD